MQYFRLVTGDNQWALGEAYHFEDSTIVDVWAYGRCEPVDDLRVVPFDILAAGPSADYNPATHGAVVISGRLGVLLRSLLPPESVQFVKAEIKGASGEWEVLNILNRIDCLDYKRSKVRFHELDHPKYPGKPSSVERLTIDPNRAREFDIFRLADWEVAVIASERLKNAMEEHGVTGIDYWPVTEDASS